MSDELVTWPVPPGVPGWGPLLMGMPRSVRAAVLGLAAHRPAGSLLRRRVLTDAVRTGFDDLNHREDGRRLDRMLRIYDPAFEFHIGAGFPLDAQPVYLGHDGLRAFMRLWDEVATVSFVCEEVLDMGGPCFALTVSANMIGDESGVSLPPENMTCAYTLERGGVVRQDMQMAGWEAAPEELRVALERVGAP